MNKLPEYNNLQQHKENSVLTQNQKRQVQTTREGIIVDNMISPKPILTDVMDSLIISDTQKQNNEKSDSFKAKKTDYTKNATVPLCLSSAGLIGAITGVTYGLKKIAEYKTKSAPFKQLPEIARNVNLNKELDFVTYAVIQNPNVKTIIGAFGFFVLASGTFVAKHCIDGFKEIWVKKQEANIQRNLQEKLIQVETKTFTGKINIVRTMLSNQAHDFENKLKIDENPKPTFRKFCKFGNTQNTEQVQSQNKKDNSLTAGLALGTALLMGGLTYLSLKNLQKTIKIIDKYKTETAGTIKQQICNSSNIDDNYLDNLKKIISALTPKSDDIKDIFECLKPKIAPDKLKIFEQDINQELKKLSQKPPENFAGTPSSKPGYFSYIDDIKGHFYNWLVNFDNPFLAALFLGLATVSGGSYIGTKTIEALKEVQVKNINANTELELQKRLVEVELKNFETKKHAAIFPLIEEFNSQQKNGKNKKELKTMATNILYEIKNGPPYIYS